MADFHHPDLDEAFPWGPIVKVHKIGDHVIVEHHPMVFDGCTGTGKYHSKKTDFTVRRNPTTGYQGASTLDHAILLAIGQAHGTGGAVQYAAQLLGVTTMARKR